MKKQIFTLSLSLIAAFGYSQSNVFPATGNVGVGTSSPGVPLEVQFRSTTEPASVYDHARFGSYIYTNGLPPIVHRNSGLFISENTSSMTLRTKYSVRPNGTESFITFIDSDFRNAATPAITLGYGTANFFSLNQDGKVRISNSAINMPQGYRLFVEDGILTEKVKVAIKNTANWADYVFAKDYKLMPLEEVEKFTKENKHLPNVPSAEDMTVNGLDVAQMDAKLLEKVEELTLYLIEQNKQIELLKAEVQTLKNKK